MAQGEGKEREGKRTGDELGWEEGWRWNSVVGVLNSHSSVALRQHTASIREYD